MIDNKYTLLPPISYLQRDTLTRHSFLYVLCAIALCVLLYYVCIMKIIVHRLSMARFHLQDSPTLMISLTSISALAFLTSTLVLIFPIGLISSGYTLTAPHKWEPCVRPSVVVSVLTAVPHWLITPLTGAGVEEGEASLLIRVTAGMISLIQWLIGKSLFRIHYCLHSIQSKVCTIYGMVFNQNSLEYFRSLCSFS